MNIVLFFISSGSMYIILSPIPIAQSNTAGVVQVKKKLAVFLYIWGYLVKFTIGTNGLGSVTITVILAGAL